MDRPLRKNEPITLLRSLSRSSRRSVSGSGWRLPRAGTRMPARRKAAMDRFSAVIGMLMRKLIIFSGRAPALANGTGNRTGPSLRPGPAGRCGFTAAVRAHSNLSPMFWSGDVSGVSKGFRFGAAVQIPIDSESGPSPSARSGPAEIRVSNGGFLFNQK